MCQLTSEVIKHHFITHTIHSVTLLDCQLRADAFWGTFRPIRIRWTAAGRVTGSVSPRPWPQEAAMSFADSVMTNKQDLGAVWKKIKKMIGQVVVSEYDLRQGNSVYSTDQAKADAFEEAFATATSRCGHAPTPTWNEGRLLTQSRTTVWRLTPLWPTPNSNEPCQLSRKLRCPPAWTPRRTTCWGRYPSLFWRFCWASSRGAGMGARSPRGGNTPQSFPSTSTANPGRS